MIDLSVVNLIVSGFGGLPVMALSQIIKGILVKRWPGLKAVFGYLISLIVSVAYTAWYSLTAGNFDFKSFIMYSIMTWAVSNGLFKSLEDNKNEKV